MPLPMGMQAQSASHPPPPPLPPPPSCSAKPRSQGSSPARRLSRAAGRSRRARPRLFPAVPEAHRAAATELSSIRHHSIPTSLLHLHTERDTGQGCCCTRAPLKKRNQRSWSYFSIAWPGNEQSRLTLRETNTLPQPCTHTSADITESEYLSSLLCCDLKMKLSLSPLRKMKKQKKKN